MIRDLPCKLDEGQNSALTCEKCPADGASNGCVHIQIDLGRTSVKDLHDFYEETHKKLGRGIANLWEVINLGEEIEYVY